MPRRAGADQAVDGRHHVAGGAVRHAAEAQLPERDLKLQLHVPGGGSRDAAASHTVQRQGNMWRANAPRDISSTQRDPVIYRALQGPRHNEPAA